MLNLKTLFSPHTWYQQSTPAPAYPLNPSYQTNESLDAAPAGYGAPGVPYHAPGYAPLFPQTASTYDPAFSAYGQQAPVTASYSTDPVPAYTPTAPSPKPAPESYSPSQQPSSVEP